ncbi:MAG: hypothetical protein FK733_15935 [Asgard group archaeon]|nr:hypothetical protein [Asgard group archaeon]
MKILTEFDLSLSNSEIVKLLTSNKAKKKSSKEPSESLISDIEKMKDIANTLISPKAIFDFFDSTKLTPKFLFKQSEQTILAVCTIGKELEKESERLMKNNSLFGGVILDAIASHAAEVLADKLNEFLIKKIEKDFQGLKYTNRFSPGYCKWTIEKGQETIFSLLPANEIGVRLSESYMMIPRKSISFAINIGSEVDTLLGIRECSTCNEINCAYRRD